MGSETKHLQHLGCIHNLAELGPETCNMDLVDGLRIKPISVPRRRGIFHQDHRTFVYFPVLCQMGCHKQVCCHPHGRGDAVVGREPGNDESAD